MSFYVSTYPRTRRWLVAPEAASKFRLAVDVREDEDAYQISALVPGLRAEDLNIQILEDVVSIAGEFKADESEHLLRELPYGAFERSLRLPTALDAQGADARITDGVLNLRVPKAESARPKTIKVQVK